MAKNNKVPPQFREEGGEASAGIVAGDRGGRA